MEKHKKKKNAGSLPLSLPLFPVISSAVLSIKPQKGQKKPLKKKNAFITVNELDPLQTNVWTIVSVACGVKLLHFSKMSKAAFSCIFCVVK